jgi:hypothetical protein
MKESEIDKICQAAMYNIRELTEHELLDTYRPFQIIKEAVLLVRTKTLEDFVRKV